MYIREKLKFYSENDNQIDIHMINIQYKSSNTRFLSINRQYFSKIIIHLSQDDQPIKKFDDVTLEIHENEIYHHLKPKYKKFQYELSSYEKLQSEGFYPHRFKINEPTNQQLFNIINDAVLDGKYGILGPSLNIQNNDDKEKFHANKCLKEFLNATGVNYKKELLISGYLRNNTIFYEKSKDVETTIFQYSLDNLSPSFFSNCNKTIKNNDKNNPNIENTICSFSDVFSKCTIL